MGASFDSGLTKLSAGANPMVNRPHMYSRLRSIARDGCPSLLIPAPAVCQQPLIPVMTLVSCWIISPQAVMSSNFWMNPFFLMTLWVWVVLICGLVLIWLSSFWLWFLLYWLCPGEFPFGAYLRLFVDVSSWL